MGSRSVYKIIFSQVAAYYKHNDGALSSPRAARHLAVEVKRKAGLDAVEQLSRYLELLNRDPLLRPVMGCIAAQSIAPQARVVAGERGIHCVVVNYDELRGVDNSDSRLF